MADAALGGLPGAASLQLRRYGEHRRSARRQHHRRLLSCPLHEEAALGAPRHRRHRMEKRPRERLDRTTGAAPCALCASPRRQIAVTSIDFYFNAQDRLQVACRLAGKALAQKKRMLIYAPEHETASRIDKMLWTWPAT